jgi:gamma-glutamyltranspeptidase/glutathione hydrolase
MAVFSIRWRRVAATFVLAFACGATAFAQERRSYAPPDLATVRAIAAEHGLVVAQERLAAEVGADILRQGGNAIDAAVATGFALAVTYPRAGNIGGGGFMVIHSAARNEDAAIDYRETAPGAITRDIFLGPDGKPDTDKSRNSALGIGVPGTVAGRAVGLVN